jgi:hypothetical protein
MPDRFFPSDPQNRNRAIPIPEQMILGFELRFIREIRLHTDIIPKIGLCIHISGPAYANVTSTAYETEIEADP